MDLAMMSIIRNGDIIKRSTRYGMLLNRREDVHQIINTIGGEPGVDAIRIYNKRGEIIFSTQQAELFTTADLSSVSCKPCHFITQPRSDLSDKERIRIFEKEDGTRILGLINPIRNEVACSDAPCHVHPANVEILGVLDVQMSLATIDEQIAVSRRSLIISSIIITLLTAIFSGIFIWLMVHIRVNELIKGARAISNGNLDYTLDIKTKDELGELALDFNEMSKNLNKAYNQIKEWNETLNLKVQEKTNQLKEIYERIVQIEKIASLGKLSATVAHEINNPLEGILTYSKLIIKKLKNHRDDIEIGKIISFLEIISSESERCGNVVKNLLLFSRVSENVIERNDLVNIIERSILLVSHHFKINNILLNKKFSCETYLIDCDKNQIQQALVAILINAVESMPNGGNLSIDLIHDNSKVSIEVADTGCGIPPENLDKIFEPFYTTKSSGKGTGLGLSVVYGIVEQHKGKISVESKINEGTKIKITLPIERITESV
jgi:two-component system NtrC family sensor kinase